MYTIRQVDNVHVRVGLLTGKLEVSSFIKMDRKSFISKKVQEERKQLEREYFEQQVIISPAKDTRVIIKTHKGEAFIEHQETVQTIPSEDAKPLSQETIEKQRKI